MSENFFQTTLSDVKKVKQFILDTDIGIDCDDAAALMVMLKAHNATLCQILGVTLSTSREGAASAVRAISSFYGIDLPIGRTGKTLACDAVNTYARAVRDRYRMSDEAESAVGLMLRLLRGAEDITIVSIGPLTNIAALVKAVPRLHEKVPRLVLMGGAFEGDEPHAEWNIVQDIEAAKIVAERFSGEIVWCPHEAGRNIKTYWKNEETPVWYAFKAFAQSEEFKAEARFENGAFSRPSWDPVTCLFALGEHRELFSLSPYGRVTVENDGHTVFTEQRGGRHRVIRAAEKDALEQLINEGWRPVSKEEKI